MAGWLAVASEAIYFSVPKPLSHLLTQRRREAGPAVPAQTSPPQHPTPPYPTPRATRPPTTIGGRKQGRALGSGITEVGMLAVSGHLSYFRGVLGPVELGGMGSYSELHTASGFFFHNLLSQRVPVVPSLFILTPTTTTIETATIYSTRQILHSQAATLPRERETQSFLREHKGEVRWRSSGSAMRVGGAPWPLRMMGYTLGWLAQLQKYVPGQRWAGVY